MSSSDLEIWISHSGAQRDWVKKLKAQCTDYRLLTYETVGGYDRKVGEKLIELSRLIAQSPGRIVVLSSEYFTSARCMEELALIFARGGGNVFCMVLYEVGDFDQLTTNLHPFADMSAPCTLHEAILHHWSIVQPKLTSAELQGYSLPSDKLTRFFVAIKDSVQVRVAGRNTSAAFIDDYAATLSMPETEQRYKEYLYELFRAWSCRGEFATAFIKAYLPVDSQSNWLDAQKDCLDDVLPAVERTLAVIEDHPSLMAQDGARHHVRCLAGIYSLCLFDHGVIGAKKDSHIQGEPVEITLPASRDPDLARCLAVSWTAGVSGKIPLLKKGSISAPASASEVPVSAALSYGPDGGIDGAASEAAFNHLMTSIYNIAVPEKSCNIERSGKDYPARMQELRYRLQRAEKNVLRHFDRIPLLRFGPVNDQARVAWSDILAELHKDLHDINLQAVLLRTGEQFNMQFFNDKQSRITNALAEILDFIDTPDSP